MWTNHFGRFVRNGNLEEALTTLKLMGEYPAGIGDHSTKDFYDNVHTTIKGSEKISNLIYPDLKYILEKQLK